MNLLTIQNLEKTYSNTPLFHGVNLSVDEKDKIGLIGKNGKGKSTLLSLIEGNILSDSGLITKKRDLDISTLYQEINKDHNLTVKDYFFLSRNKKIISYKAYIDALKTNDKKLIQEKEKELEQIEAKNILISFKAFLTEMGESDNLDRTFSSLSGGEKKKISIARTLSTKSDLLLLDEPTNHLDIKTIKILESYLKKTKTAFILVTHDRELLENTVNTIWELEDKRIYQHSSSYSLFLERKEERLNEKQKEEDRIKTILKREKEWLMRGPKARTGKDKGRKERIEAMEKTLEKEKEKSIASFSSLSKRSGKKILEIENISKKFEDKTLFKDFSFSFQKSDRIGLIGDNGSGKTTLLDILYGKTEPTEGTIEKGINTVFSYYDQTSNSLNNELSVLNYALKICERVKLNKDEELSVSSFLDRFGFQPEEQKTLIKNLSGGEKRRLYLITRLLISPNFLLLDEPTNDLDIETIEKLEDYIFYFEGPVLISSHDRSFLDMCTNMTLEIKNEEIKLYPSSYSYIKREEENVSNSKIKEKEKKAFKEKEKKGLSFKEKKEKEELESEIEKLEHEIKELEESFSNLKDTEYSSLKEKTKTYEEKKERLEFCTERWFCLEESS